MRPLLVILLLSGLFYSCKQNKSSDSDENQAGVLELKESLQFDANLAYGYVQKQIAFGPRVPSTKAHELCAEWIIKELKSSTDTVYYQEFSTTTYDGKTHQGKNIMAKLNPTNINRVLLSAHWDSRHIADKDRTKTDQPILGADDGGSGVAVILALMQSLQKNNPKLGIDIVFFDIEDYGQPENSGLPPMEGSWCLGSQYWAGHYSEGIRPRWGILLDMVGAKGATFPKEEISMLYASHLVSDIWEVARQLGYSSIFIPENMGSIQDDHMYINTLAQIPTVDILGYNVRANAFGRHHHTHMDNMSIMDKTTLLAVGRVLEYFILKEEKIVQ